jgi:peptidoglycan/LPS O-acetylase OafA/YrhL
VVELIKSHSVTVDYLKLLAVVCIVVDHLIELAVGFNWGIWCLGAFGVGLFVYVSGFLSKTSVGEIFNAKQFMLKRFVKLYPLYLLVSVFSFSMQPTELTLQLSNVFMIYPVFWFVPFITALYALFVVSKINIKVFRLLCLSYVIGLTGSAFYFYSLGNGSQTLFNLYWVALLGVFFIGVKTSRLNLKLPSSALLQTIGAYSYPIYLFQVVFIDAALKTGLAVSLLYVVLALSCYVGVKYELAKKT